MGKNDIASLFLSVLLLFLALASSVATFYYRSQIPPLERSAGILKKEKLVLAARVEAQAETIRMLERQKARLDARLDDASGEQSPDGSPGLDEPFLSELGVPKSSPWNKWAERLEQMKRDNPERYARLRSTIDSFRSRVADHVARKSAFFMNVNTANMTPEQKENHDSLMALLEETWVLQERLTEDAESTDAAAVRRQLHRNVRDMEGLMREQRRYVLTELGRDADYTGEEIEVFADYIETIYNMTTVQPLLYSPSSE